MHKGADLYFAGVGAESLLLLSVNSMSMIAYLGLTLSQCPSLWLPNEGHSFAIYCIPYTRQGTTEVSGKDNCFVDLQQWMRGVRSRSTYNMRFFIHA